MHRLFRTKKYLALALAVLLSFAMAQDAVASAKRLTVKASTAKVWSEPRTSSKVVLSVKKNKSVSVYDTRGDWAKVMVDGKKGFMRKDAFTASTSSNDTEPKYRKLSSGKSGKDVLALQNRLIDRGYLSKGSATGYYSSATVKAVKTFQLQNGFSVTGKASEKTQEKLYASSAKKKVSIIQRDWFKQGIGSFPRGGIAVIVDVKTGTRISIRRVGGHNHADIEPKTAEDTEKLLKVYGGKWSWSSRPVILILNGRYIAAAINGMPHGDAISNSNNFDGQFCLHTLNSRTHGTDKENVNHQSSIKYAYNAFN